MDSTVRDIQRVTAFMRRSMHGSYCTMDLADNTSIIDTTDDILFYQILTNANHVLAHLLLEKASMHYSLRLRQNDRELILNYIAVTSIIRVLYKHSF